MNDRVLPPAELADRLGEVYRVVGPLYRKVFRVVERDERQMGMSVGVRAVLDQLLAAGDLTVPQMARDQDLSRQFVQRMVHDAAGEGWVETVENPAHRRSSLIHLTEAGRSAITRVVQHEHDLMGQVSGDLTAAEIEATLRVLGEMLAALERVESDQA